MAQNDLSISNADGATVRADFNSALQAEASKQSGTAAPSTTYAFQNWMDTTTGILKIRNSGNSAHISVGTLGTGGFVPFHNGNSFAAVGTSGLASDLSCTGTSDNAGTGKLGEYFGTGRLAASGTNLTTGSAVNVLSIALTAGDWDVEGHTLFQANGTTSVTAYVAAINTVSQTLPTLGSRGAYINIPFTSVGQSPIIPTGRGRVSLGAAGTVYLVGQCNFTGTVSAAGYMEARRVR